MHLRDLVGTRLRARRLVVVIVSLPTATLTVASAQPAWAPTNPRVRILNATDGCCSKVVDVANWATNDGAPVHMWDCRGVWDCTGAWNQDFGADLERR